MKDLPCCNTIHLDALKWNPYSGVFQCHKCGTVYDVTPRGPAKEPAPVYYTHKSKGGRYYIIEQWQTKAAPQDAWVHWVKYRSTEEPLTFVTSLNRWLDRFTQVSA